MLIDEIQVRAHAGDGGRGAVAFQKVKLAQGPTGGDGGRGGNIFFEGVADINALRAYAHRGEIKAENGRNGRGKFLDGRTGEDVILKIPIGTVVTNNESGFTQELQHVGQRILASGGGVGGLGNFKFRSGSNTTPLQFTEGSAGDHLSFTLKLRLIADVGLVGLPNAGKSSLLNELTAAKSKVANYAFTTLEPHLGAYYELILADIPGLIEGASDGKGLGVKFLKHIERTKILFHLISAESQDPVGDYRTIRKELERYGAVLGTKEERVFVTKADTVSPEELAAKIAVLKKAGIAAVALSIVDDESMKKLRELLNQMKAEKLDGKL